MSLATGGVEYDFLRIEPHWQRYWEGQKAFRAVTGDARPPYYLLEMYPYPSGAGLHAGHAENFSAGDILARYKWARGYNVLHPMGWDAFGLPAEQYALKTGTHPAVTTAQNVATFTRQLKALGLALDWDREVNTTDPGYYKWTQWIFLQLFKQGLAFVSEQPVNWCPALGTVLANEEVIDGKSEVGGHPVERRNLRQWVLRITAYAEKLLDGHDELAWPESSIKQQKNWIGKSTGAEVSFRLEGRDGELRVYTTRPDTLYGVTYMVVAPEHPLVPELTRPEQAEAVRAYVEAARLKSDLDRTELAKEKTGVFTGSHAINPLNGERVPIWIADYVLMSYGTGAIMAVPAHDERDFAFAEAYGLPVVRVIDKRDAEGRPMELPFTDVGTMVNSGPFDGLASEEGKARIIAKLEAEGLGKGAVNYRLRDWLFSRQRYWGEPFPIVWVGQAAYEAARAAQGAVAAWLPEEPVAFTSGGERQYAIAVPEGQLPLTLPETENYRPSGTGESPLANVTEWVEIWVNVRTGEAQSRQLPKPAGEDWYPARRETNTMPQWAGSCWYYLRYLDPKNDAHLIGPEALAYWGSQADFYMGGTEHVTLHLLYARFWHRFLYDIGVVNEAEPFHRLFHQGIILGTDGEKMSKSRGNVVNPDDYIASHGADSLRAYLMFMGPLEDAKPWNTQGIEGVHRFLRKVWREIVGREGEIHEKLVADGDEEPETRRLLHETIKKVTGDMEGLRFNTAVSNLMIFMNHIGKVERWHRKTATAFLQLLAPICPHIAEELWARLGEQPSIAHAPWPTWDEAVLQTSTVMIPVMVNGKPRGEIAVGPETPEAEALALALGQERLRPHLEGKTVRKVIYKPGQVLNLVVG